MFCTVYSVVRKPVLSAVAREDASSRRNSIMTPPSPQRCIITWGSKEAWTWWLSRGWPQGATRRLDWDEESQAGTSHDSNTLGQVAESRSTHRVDGERLGTGACRMVLRKRNCGLSTGRRPRSACQTPICRAFPPAWTRTTEAFLHAGENGIPQQANPANLIRS
jgi:hypothetical protein